MSESIKLNDNKYIDATGVYDSTLNQTQRQINSNLANKFYCELASIVGVDSGENERRPYIDFEDEGAPAGLYLIGNTNGNSPYYGDYQYFCVVNWQGNCSLSLEFGNTNVFTVSGNQILGLSLSWGANLFAHKLHLPNFIG